jgi:hypothetical protein
MGNSGSLEETDTQSLDNYDFYSNRMRSQPQGDLIDNIHTKWFGNWSLLEAHHGYIQWLFPIREGGMNTDSQPMSKHEASLFRSDATILNRVVQSYRLMLDFYGLVLVDDNSGQIARNPVTYQKRYRHLNHSFHNYLRITRIMKSLGVVGLEHYKFAFLHHMALEVFREDNLSNTAESFVKYWAPTLRKEDQLKYIDNLCAKHGRRINRDGRDGYGDEQGDNWQTEHYPTNALFPSEVDVFSFDYVKNESLINAPNDPFASNRS